MLGGDAPMRQQLGDGGVQHHVVLELGVVATQLSQNALGVAILVAHVDAQLGQYRVIHALQSRESYRQLLRFGQTHSTQAPMSVTVRSTLDPTRSIAGNQDSVSFDVRRHERIVLGRLLEQGTGRLLAPSRQLDVLDVLEYAGGRAQTSRDLLLALLECRLFAAGVQHLGCSSSQRQRIRRERVDDLKVPLLREEQGRAPGTEGAGPCDICQRERERVRYRSISTSIDRDDAY